MGFITNSEYGEHLKKNLDVLVNNGKIGLSKFAPDDIQSIPNKYLEVVKGYKFYHFCINVPYAARVLNWEVIFDPEDYSELPDFEFNDNTFLPEPDIDYIAENVPSWDAWDLTNSQSLLNILNEFLVLYKKSQIDILEKQNKFVNWKEQYEELLTTLNLTADDIEVHIETKNEPDNSGNSELIIHVLSFLIVLPINLSPLPQYAQDEMGVISENPGDDFVQLSFLVKGRQTKISLSISPKAELLMGKLRLPVFRNETLAKYALTVQALIESEIKSIAHHIVECDTTRFSKINFIFEELEDYDCLVTIQLNGTFPHEAPKVKVHSLYCQVGSSCVRTVLCPYDPKTTAEENVAVLRVRLLRDVEMFKNHTH
ncbi:BRISC and BRCA1-A complex member 2 [Dendroctonus ponderosae]|uniref:BRISC and BRCA1-A complex member 2 n=1 Tax=Dendroctonus ponderosae TaxID=77166 RepID=UPI002034E00A|nr:BRISC and BRCA1-A complex member 2 [Dendroctonus ponderosae]